ncbi:hypothetical protein J1N35_046055 [Gossypium stocksii]|uniref:Uncharacterized protein n=1 Tax=Gossypium stocksii TaxID=47602 RepID=A0A9D3U593_9ROSI|nr:hypothetical protein J1N35_046055 [Gossypium stocksii]
MSFWGWPLTPKTTLIKIKRHHIRKVFTRYRLPKNGFLMEESIIQTTEKNAVVQDWSLKTQKEQGIFTERYGDIANLIAVNVDERLI